VVTLSCPRAGRAGCLPISLLWWEELDFAGWDSEISGSLLFQPSDFTLMFKYLCVLSFTTANLREGGKPPKFISSKQCQAALMPGWEISPSQWGGRWTVACQTICSPALERCGNGAGGTPCSAGPCGSLWLLAPGGDERVGSGLALGWARRGLAAAAVFRLSVLPGRRQASLMFPLLLLPGFVPAVPLGLLPKSSCGRLSLHLFLLLGRFCSLCPVAWQEAGQLPAAVAVAAKQRCSTSLAAVEAGREPSSVLSVCETEGSSAFTSIPVHSDGYALRSLIKRKASSTLSCFYEIC